MPDAGLSLFMYPRQESNLDLKFRKLLFYPLNYEGVDFKTSANLTLMLKNITEKRE